MICKICHISSVHSLTDTRIFHKEIQTLANKGYEVTYIVQNGKDEEIDEVKVKGLKKPKNRIERMTKTVQQLYNYALNVDADIYHFHDPELISVGLMLKKKGKKVIYDVHEDVPRQILSKQWIYAPFRKMVSWVVEKIENFAAKRFDYIVTATPNIRERFSKLNNNSIDINNYPILSELYTPEVDWNEKEKVVCYVGGITEARGIHEMVDAIDKTDYRLLIAGSFSLEAERSKCIDHRGWTKVVELGHINREEVKQVLSKSMAGLVLFHPEPNHIDAQPNKMFEYMAAGIPVIASNFPLWKEIIESNTCGICVDPLNTDEIAEAIKFIIENPEQAEQMGQNGRKAVEEKYNWENEAQKLIDIYESSGMMSSR